MAACSARIAQAADTTELERRIAAHLASGEFGPALQLAEQAADRRDRDRLLARVAEGQVDAGILSSLGATAARIGDDRVRADLAYRAATRPVGGRGGQGGAQLEFDSVIELITSTVAPPSWDAMGGQGSIAGFTNGVYVDPEGVLRAAPPVAAGLELAELRAASAPGTARGAQRDSSLRKVSLTRLEKHVQLRLAAGQAPTEEMALLAGLERIEYVLVYPQTGDIVLAGPAGAWHRGHQGRIVSARTGRPVLRLDDLVVVLRHVITEPDTYFGCSITPTEDGLARVRQFAADSAKMPLAPNRREAWLEEIRGRLGRQTIDVFGIDPRTRVAQVIVEADYHMKLVGLGLEPGVLGVTSFLESIEAAGGAPPALDVLRWWFTLNYDAVRATPERDAFELRGQGVKVLSENQFLTERGERIATGQSDQLNAQFAASFTRHYRALAEKYPVYAELQNICDLALVAALLKAEDLPGRVGWHLTCFGDPAGYPVLLGAAPRTVESVAAHRVINRVHVVAAVSGGVRIDTAPLVRRQAIDAAGHDALSSERDRSVPPPLPLEAWWWD